MGTDYDRYRLSSRTVQSTISTCPKSGKATDSFSMDTRLPTLPPLYAIIFFCSSTPDSSFLLSSSMHCNMIDYSDTGISLILSWSCEVEKLRLSVDRPSCRVDLSATRSGPRGGNVIEHLEVDHRSSSVQALSHPWIGCFSDLIYIIDQTDELGGLAHRISCQQAARQTEHTAALLFTLRLRPRTSNRLQLVDCRQLQT